jgi:hypothetical protein
MPNDKVEFYTVMKAYIDASKHFTDASAACFVVLSDPTSAPANAEEIGQHQEEAADELRNCLERVNLMLEELAARPEHEAAETEEQRELAELRRMAEAEAEADAEGRGEWIDTGEPDGDRSRTWTRSPRRQLGRTGKPPGA